MRKPSDPQHKIFHPSRWREIDIYTSICNYELGLSNSDSVDNLVQSPVKQIVWEIIIIDYILLRVAWTLSRIPLVLWLVVSYPLYAKLRINIGHSGWVKRLQKRRAEMNRNINDPEVDEHLQFTRDIHGWLREDLLK